MEIGVTSVVKQRIKKIKISDINKSKPIFCWDTHLVKFSGKNVLFIVNVSSCYTIIVTGMTMKNWNNYQSYISRCIAFALKNMGYTDEQIQKYFDLSSEVILTKTHGKKSVGNFSRIIRDLLFVEEYFDRNSDYQIKMMNFANRLICKTEAHNDYDYAFKYFQEDLESIEITLNDNK